MKTERQKLLLRKMRRSLIALQIQTPKPVFQRIPSFWYLSVVLALIVLTALVSTRAALLFRAEVDATQARVVYVQKANLDRRKARAAALIDYQQLPRYVEKIPVPETEPEHTSVKIVEKPKLKVAPVHKVSARETAPIVISSRRAQPSLPESIEDAFHRLSRVEDMSALNWLIGRSEAFRYEPAWERFQQATTAADTPLRAYQLSVLFGALGDESKAYRWSSSAVSLSSRPRYIRAYAVAADRLGEYEEAAAAYRRYLAVAPEDDLAQITARIAVLESP